MALENPILSASLNHINLAQIKEEMGLSLIHISEPTRPY